MQTSIFGKASRVPEGHGNRGKSLEDALSYMHAVYAARGWARIDKQHLPAVPVKDGKWAKVIGKAIVDYVGVLSDGQFVAFDAKSIHGERIPLAELKDHQREYLNEVRKLGGAAFVLVWFKDAGEGYAVPVDVWDATRWQGKKSIRRDAMRPEWRVEGYDWLSVLVQPAVRTCASISEQLDKSLRWDFGAMEEAVSGGQADN